jgi:putative transposase
MPNRFTDEHYPDGVYHVMNRGVERRPIFLNAADYRRFKLQLQKTLTQETGITLWAYCLMPNHFHLLIKQANSDDLRRFMQRVGIAYAMYFNRRYHRVGPLFQGRYRTVRVIGEQQVMEVSRYIHLNPERAGLGWLQHQHSSLGDYLGERSDGIADPTAVLGLFDNPSDYGRYLSGAKSRS